LTIVRPLSFGQLGGAFHSDAARYGHLLGSAALRDIAEDKPNSARCS
jgi:hypothetical protein